MKIKIFTMFEAGYRFSDQATTMKNAFIRIGFLAILFLFSHQAGAFYDPNVGRWLSRDPIGDVAFISNIPKELNSISLTSIRKAYLNANANPYCFIRNRPITGVDLLGLADCKDSAKRTCCCDKMKEVQLLLDSSFFDLIGHAFIGTPSGNSGFYPVNVADAGEWFGTLVIPGRLVNDDGHRYSVSVKYKACPETVDILQKDIQAHANDQYQLINIQARNCLGWAAERLNSAGFTTGLNPSEPFLRPSGPGGLGEVLQHGTTDSTGDNDEVVTW